MNKIELLINDLVNKIIIELNSHLTIYQTKQIKRDNLDIIEVLLDSDEAIDLAQIVPITERVQEIIQNEDQFPDGFYLEIASVGVEKPLRNLEEIEKQIDKYVYFELKEMVKNSLDWYGYVVKVENEVISLKINNRGRIQTVDIKYDIIKSARCAVKF